MFDKHKKFIYVLPQKRRHNLLSKSFGRHKTFIDLAFYGNRENVSYRYDEEKKYEFIIG